MAANTKIRIGRAAGSGSPPSQTPLLCGAHLRLRFSPHSSFLPHRNGHRRQATGRVL